MGLGVVQEREGCADLKALNPKVLNILNASHAEMDDRLISPLAALSARVSSSSITR